MHRAQTQRLPQGQQPTSHCQQHVPDAFAVPETSGKIDCISMSSGAALMLPHARRLRM